MAARPVHARLPSRRVSVRRRSLRRAPRWVLGCALLSSTPTACDADPTDVPGPAAPTSSRNGVAPKPRAAPEPKVEPTANAEPAANTEPGPADPALPEAPPPKPELRLAFAGDIIFGRYRADGFDPIVEGELAPFAAMREALAADLTIANLETPLVRELPKVSPSRAAYRFGASKTMAQHLVDAGFDVLSVANNHHNDQRERGQRETLEILEELGIHAIGKLQAQAPAIRFETVEVEGWRVAFAGMSTRLNMPLAPAPPHFPFAPTKEIPTLVSEALAEARATHDLVVVSIHWGEEYTDHPTYRQVQVARQLIDEGADVVFGHHAHVLQGVERHGEGVIAYSMGNFLFENASAIPKLTGVLKLDFARSPAGAERPACLSAAMFFPAVMQRKPYHHPEPATGLVGRQVRARMQSLSRALRTQWREGEPADRAPMRMDFVSTCEAPAEASKPSRGKDAKHE